MINQVYLRIVRTIRIFLRPVALIVPALQRGPAHICNPYDKVV